METGLARTDAEASRADPLGRGELARFISASQAWQDLPLGLDRPEYRPAVGRQNLTPDRIRPTMAQHSPIWGAADSMP